MPNILTTLSFPIPSDFHSIPFTKDISSSPSLVEAFEEGFGQVRTNRNEFNHPSPSYIGIHNEGIPNKVFNLGFMPLFLLNTLLLRWI